MTTDNQALQLLKQQLTLFQPKQIEATLTLLQEGNTVPFIARYRKEMTNSLDEVQIKTIDETYRYLQNLVERKEEVTRLIDEQGKLTSDIQLALQNATKLQQVEDIYRPYKQKKRTKATIAKEKGLEPLALQLLALPKDDIRTYAQSFVTGQLDDDNAVETIDDAINGALDIVIEMISDNATYREFIRRHVLKNGHLIVNVKDEQNDVKHVYEMYYDYTEAISQLKEHRILAINRGEKEDVLKVAIDPAVDKIMHYFEKQLIKNPNNVNATYLRQAYTESFKKYIMPSIEREIRQLLTQKADEKAIAIFGENLQNLLMQPPMKDSVVLGLDPAYRTGCKLAVVDATGLVLDKGVIYPHKPASAQKRQEASGILKQFISKHNVSMIAIGNGTASRESELFVAQVIKELPQTIHYVIVNEAGASVYSASEVAREEFPTFQVEERSAVSIARRLQDPLAELVKIDPKSVGVGQYQHDVSQKALSEQLNFVVELVVNKVGVNLNTASRSLLQHVSGLNKTTAQNIVAFRNENGAFTNRKQLKNVARLGPKAYEQAVGFLRIPNGDNVLDNTAIHPENYDKTIALLNALNISLSDVANNTIADRLNQLNIDEAVTLTQLGKETISDIVSALEKPGRDIRESIAAPLLRVDVLAMEDLKVGMSLQGTVRNVVDFGAFVDIGVKQDGLVHLSKMSQKFVKHAMDIVSVGDIVTVWIDGVDMAKNRISLTMVDPHA